MFGTRDAVQNAVSNFWIDYIEIPGMSYKDAVTRYTYRMQEQDNIWEYYQLLIQRLRIYVDNPFTAGPDGFAPDDNSQLYTLREGLINMLAHADYFSPMHSTIRVYSNRIEFQNAGRFIMDLDKLKGHISSMPRNPSIIKFFRYAKLSENAGYGIDKMMMWKEMTGKDVLFESELTHSNVIYMLPDRGGVSNPTSTRQVPDKYPTSTRQASSLSLVEIIGNNIYSLKELMELMGLKDRENFLNNHLNPNIDNDYVEPTYPDNPKHPKQKYRLTEKGKALLNIK